jgi:hypothetical protein
LEPSNGSAALARIGAAEGIALGRSIVDSLQLPEYSWAKYNA